MPYTASVLSTVHPLPPRVRGRDGESFFYLSPVLLIQAPVEGLQVVATASPCVRYSAANCAMRSGSRPLPQNNPGFDPCQRAAGDLHAAAAVGNHEA